MDVCLRTVAALFLLVAAASCAPAEWPKDACAAVKDSSLDLNHAARMASITARNGSKDVTDFSTSLAWLEVKDMCDPEALRRDSTTCVGKIIDVLTSYKFAVEKVAEFPSCSACVRDVEPAIQRLQRDINTCVKSKGGSHYDQHNSIEEIQPIPGWQKALLCQYTMDRLFSFSILTARVFGEGDPAQHEAGSAQRCM